MTNNTMTETTRVLHSTFSLTRRGGGVYEVLKELMREMSSAPGVSLQAVGPQDEQFCGADWHVNTQMYAVKGPAVFGYSRQLPEIYAEFQPQICHLHGVWMHYSKVNLDYATRQGVPYVISPHGMLDRWALANSGWKKQIVRLLFEDRHLARAKFLHALCESEADEFRRLGLNREVRIIPNGVTIQPQTNELPNWDFESGRPVMLFLSRLHPKKGLLEFLQAWAKSKDLWQKESWAFAIAGWDQSGYADQLRKFISESGLENDVKLIGPVFGEQKQAVFQQASAFVLPSFSEGLPVAVLEAWANRLPVLMTDRCNLPQGFAQHAAVRIDDRPDKMHEGLRDFLTWKATDRQTTGQNGRDLVEDRFTWPQVTRQYLELYEDCLKGS